jgi:hypothetical protein
LAEPSNLVHLRFMVAPRGFGRVRVHRGTACRGGAFVTHSEDVPT